MMTCMWVQACGATNGRFVDRRATTCSARRRTPGELRRLAPGVRRRGLVDIRRVKALARAAGDSTGSASRKVWEALTIGTASDLWGDIPIPRSIPARRPPLDDRSRS